MSKRVAMAVGASVMLMSACGGDAVSPDERTAEPALPPAAAEYLVVTDNQLPIDGEGIAVNEDHRLTTPAGTLTLTTAGTLRSVPADLDESEPGQSGSESTPAATPEDLRPADGYQFMSAEFLVEVDSGIAVSSSTPNVSLAVDRATIGDLVGVYEDGRTEGTIVASVPEDAEEIELIVDFEGLTQTLDFRTGERTSTSAAAYYDGGNDRLDPTSENRIGATVTVPYTGRGDPGECVITATGSVATAYRAPWLDGQGWAPDGFAWIAVELSAFDTADQCTNSSAFFVPAETREFFSLVTSVDEPLPLVMELDDLLVFQVPEDQLTVSLRVTVFGEVLGAEPDVIPVTLPPADIALDFT